MSEQDNERFFADDRGNVVDFYDGLEGTTFRMAEFERGACVKAIWCRMDRHDGQWRVALFRESFGAAKFTEPLASVDERLLGIAELAFRRAQEWIEEQYQQ